MRKETTRRSVLATTGSILTAGCVGGNLTSSQSQSSGQKTTTAETTTIADDCGTKYKSPTDQAIDQYRGLTEDFVTITNIIGTSEQFKTDSVFGSSGFFHMNCSSDCESEFLTAIKKFRRAKSGSEDVKGGFSSLETHITSCEVEETELFKEQIANGKEKAQAYANACDKFIASAKRHVDEDLQQFSPGPTFNEGLREYKQAHEMGIMSADLLEKKIEIYSG